MRRSTRQTKDKEMRQRGYSLNESGQWVKKEPAAAKKTMVEEDGKRPREEEEETERKRLRVAQDEEYRRSVEADRLKVTIQQFKEKIQKCIIEQDEMLGWEAAIAFQRFEGRYPEGAGLMKGLACNLLDTWNRTREESTRDLLVEVLRHAIPDEEQRRRVFDFVRRVKAAPDVEDPHYRHTISLHAREVGEIMGFDLKHMAKAKVDEWREIQRRARQSKKK